MPPGIAPANQRDVALHKLKQREAAGARRPAGDIAGPSAGPAAVQEAPQSRSSLAEASSASAAAAPAAAPAAAMTTPGAVELATAALQQERALQAARDAQVLHLLKSKDDVIESFEARHAEARAEILQLKEQLGTAHDQLEASRARVQDLITSKADLRKQHDSAAAVGAEVAAGLRAEIAQMQDQAAACEPLRREKEALEQQLADAAADLLDAQQQLHALADAVDAANVAITELQALLTEREEAVADKDAETQELHRHLERLLGLPASDARLVHRAHCGLGPADARLATLQAANERLEAALVEAVRSAAAGADTGVPAEPSAEGSDADAVGKLTARLAVQSGQLQAAEERVAQLEKLLKVAQATVLHNEVQLQETLEGRMAAEEQVHSLRLDLEDSQALLQQLKTKLAGLSASEQAAQHDAAAVRGALAAAMQHMGSAPATREQAEQRAGMDADVAAASLPAAPAPESQNKGSLGEDVGAAMGALLSRIAALEQQLAGAEEAAAAAAAQLASRPDRQAVGVQCEGPALHSQAVQASPLPAAAVRAGATQTEDEEAGQAECEQYGRPDAQQQQVADLTAQLAAARLAEVAAKAEQAAAEARLLDMERTLDEQRQETAAGAARCAAGACSAAEQLRTECSSLQLRVEELQQHLAAVEAAGAARLAQAAAESAAREQSLRSELQDLRGSATELSELRSSAYAAMHRVRLALKEQGAVPAALPDGCEPSSLAHELRQAVDALLSMVQEHGELVSVFQQHIHHDASQPSSSGMPLEASQRQVIRSLAAQVASLQLGLEQAGLAHHHLEGRVQLLRSTLVPSSAAEAESALSDAGNKQLLPARASVPARDAGLGGMHVVGLLGLLRQQLSSLEGIQQQLERAERVASPGPGSPGASSKSEHLQSSAHAAALLGTELPALHATVAVLEGELQRMAAQGGAAPSGAAGSIPGHGPPAAALAGGDGCASAAPSAGDSEQARRADKWKLRCKALQTKLETATAAAQQAEAALHERASTVLALQQRVEELAAAGSQLESVLQDTAQQLLEATRQADALRRQLDSQQQEHQQALREAQSQAAEAQSALEQHGERMQGLSAGLQSSGQAETKLRSQLLELSEEVALLTSAQADAEAELRLKELALTAAQQELAGMREAHATLAAEKAAGEEDMACRLEQLQQECVGMLAVLQRAEQQHAEVEQRLQAQLAEFGAQLDGLHAGVAADLPALSAALATLQHAAEGLDVRLLRAEAQAAVAMEDRQDSAAARWGHLVRSRRYCSAVKTLRDGLQAQLLDVQAANEQASAQLEQLQAALEAVRGEASLLASQLQEAQLVHQQSLQEAARQHEQELAAVHAERETERQRLQREAEAATAAAVTAAEERCRVESAARACQLEQRALAELQQVEAQCGEQQAQLDGMRRQFKRYQAIKAVEVRLLEQRVLQQLQGGSSTGSRKPEPAGAAPAAAGGGAEAAASPASLADLEAACCEDGVAAALREARLERVQREAVQKELSVAQQAREQLGARAKAAEHELAALKSRQGPEARAARERCESLAAELAECQNALRLAKQEGSRRLKELQALQRQAAASENSGPNAAMELEGEQEARKAAEEQLRQARQELARKAALVKELRGKVACLERELREQDPAPLAAELEACQSRLRQAQAACGSKDAAVRELRERLEQQTKLARQQGMLEERQAQQAELRRLDSQLADRDLQLSALHQQLRQLQHDLAAATADLQQAAAGQSAEAQDAAARLAAAQQSLQELADVVRLLLEALAQLGAAAASGSGSCSQGEDAADLAAAATDLAGLVDLSADDIGAVLDANGQAPSSGAATQLEAATRQAWTLLHRLSGPGTGEVGVGAPAAELREAAEQCCLAAAQLAGSFVREGWP